ncbi:MAG: hypothetical protein OEM27_01905 [Nitrospinota bacterium]|nr:hypothetical protein [Nitrospinota bacterium]
MAIRFMFATLLGVWIAGCMPDTNYQAYEDQNEKGEQAFLKDLQVCRNSVNQHLKRNEGSLGDRLNRKRSLFLRCMENHYWVLKT